MLALTSTHADASIAYGSINNFVTLNDTGHECHGLDFTCYPTAVGVAPQKLTVTTTSLSPFALGITASPFISVGASPAASGPVAGGGRPSREEMSPSPRAPRPATSS